MGWNRRIVEEIIGHVPDVEIRLPKSETIRTACRPIVCEASSATDEQTLRWRRRDYSGVSADGVKQLNELEGENHVP